MIQQENKTHGTSTFTFFWVIANLINEFCFCFKQLTQEKNELIEETASLKSEIGNLKIQYQQRLMVMRPWPAINPTVVIAPIPYSFPVPIPVPPAQIPVHQFMRPLPFFGIRSPGPIPNAHSTFISYPAAAYASTSRISSIGSKSSNHCWGCDIENDCDSNDLDTLLELKTQVSPSREVSFWLTFRVCLITI